MFINLIIYFLAFAGIWVGSGFAVRSVERISRTFKMSSFMVSFLVLGFFTSIGELSVGINSILDDNPEIYVGNLIGASIILLMLIVPLLAIAGNSIRIAPEFRGFNLPASLIVIALPVILAMDGKVGRMDSVISLALFFFLLVGMQAKRSLVEKLKKINKKTGIRLGKELIKIVFGVAVIFIASRFVVEQTVYFSELLGVSPFLVSLLLIAIGTNIPELSLVIRSVFMKNNQVAFGDYIGSAAFNTFLLGLLTFIYGGQVTLTNSYMVSLLFLVVGLLVFYYFARTKNTISRAEGVVLLMIYVAFLATEIVLHKNLIFWNVQ